MSWSAEKNESCPTCEFQNNLNILREIYFFSALPIDTLKVFAYLCTRENFKPGDFLFTQEDDDGQAFYLISGEAALIRYGKRRRNGRSKLYGRRFFRCIDPSGEYAKAFFPQSLDSRDLSDSFP